MNASIGTILLSTLAASLSQLAAQEPQKPAAKAPTTEIARENCVTSECHSQTKQHVFLHGPLTTNSCDSCHKLVDVEKHSYEDIRPQQEMCLFCHELDYAETDLVHEPLAQGECLPCHQPHGGTGPKLLRGKSYPDSCRNCHKGAVGDRNFVHGPASAGSCGACHEPHASPNRKLLTSDGNRMCLRCHVTIELQLEVQHLVHAPVKDGCDVCHDPHATDNPGMLIDDPVSLCIKCHEEVGQTVTESRHEHGALNTDQGCLSCHDPHASDHPQLLLKSPDELCYECHDKPVESKHGRTIPDIKAKITNAVSIHGPVAQGNCVACHHIHGADHSRLLASEYGTNIYKPFSTSQYSLCFNCHDRQLVREETTTQVTAFRNGDQNLHYLHVNREKKSRSCRVCHDSHASLREHHLRDSFPYGPGGFQLAIGWVAGKDGGECAAGCHVAAAYDRANPIQYVQRKDGSRDWRGERLVPGAQPPVKTDPDKKRGDKQ